MPRKREVRAGEDSGAVLINIVVTPQLLGTSIGRAVGVRLLRVRERARCRTRSTERRRDGRLSERTRRGTSEVRRPLLVNNRHHP